MNGLIALALFASTLTEWENEIKKVLSSAEQFEVTVEAHDIIMSGTIIDGNGHVITGIVPNKDSVIVKLPNGREIEARVVGRDETMGLTLIETGITTQTPLLGHKVEKGNLAIILGTTMGVEHAFILGYVLGIMKDGRLLVTIPTYAGITGAPVFNSKGKLIGVLSSALSPAKGITLKGFEKFEVSLHPLLHGHNVFTMIPIDTVRKRAQRIIKEGDLKQAWLGVGVAKGENGVLVLYVINNSPADKAGIEKGDIIKAINGKTIERPDQLKRILREMTPGDTVTLIVLRKNREIKVSAVLSSKPLYFKKFSPFGSELPEFESFYKDIPKIETSPWQLEEVEEELQDEIEELRKEIRALRDSLRKELKEYFEENKTKKLKI